MMVITINLLSSILIYIFSAASPIDSFNWLIGSWEMKKSDGSSRMEVWERKDDSTLIGSGLKVNGADTSILEALELVFRDDRFWYIPTVPDQNEAKPIPFELTGVENNRFEFENEKHDFPQRIIYHLKPMMTSNEPTPGDTLAVRVESMNGKGISFIFFRK